MVMERQIALFLNHRDRFSHGNSRKVFGYEAYHWGIMIMPKVSQGGDCQVFETSDADEIDPVTWRMTNPTMDWLFKATEDVDPTLLAKLLGRIVIGAVPAETSSDDLKELFGKVPLPQKNQHPQQSCVTWVVNAIQLLQDKEWVPEFDINEFKDWALRYADDMLEGKGTTEGIVEYPRCKEVA